MKKIIPFLIILAMLLSMTPVFAENNYTVQSTLNVITISGTLPSKNEGVAVTVIVLKPNAEINDIDMSNPFDSVEHINNATTDKDGKFSVTFSLDTTAYSNPYFIRVGCSEFSTSQDMVFKYFSDQEIKDIMTAIKQATSSQIINDIITVVKDNGSINGDIIGINMNYYNSDKLNNEERLKICADILRVKEEFDNDNLEDSLKLLNDSFSTSIGIINAPKINDQDSLDIFLDEYATLFSIDTERYSNVKTDLHKNLIAKEFASTKSDNNNMADNFLKSVAKVEINNVATNKDNFENTVLYYKNKNVINVDVASSDYTKNKAKLYQKLLALRPFSSLNDFENKYAAQLSEISSNNTGGGGNLPSTGGGGNVVITPPTNPIATPIPTPTSTPENEIFSDLADVSWAKESIKNLYDLKIVSGSNGKFYPSNNVTREEFVKMVVEAFDITINEKKKDFSDVTEDKWYYNYVNIAYSNGIVNGKAEDLFGAGQYITREEMATIINNVLKLKNISLPKVNDKKVFVDHNNIAEYAKEGVYLLQESDIIKGYENGEFLPRNNATRAESAVIISSILKNI